MNEQVLAVQRMQDYIQEHITEDIRMSGIARAAGYSPWHARRLFLSYLAVSPTEYVRKYRLRLSALMLRDDKCTVLEVAMRLGFGSVDGYQRAFLREFGCNPKEYAANPIPLSLFTPYGIKAKYLEKKDGYANMNTKNIFLQVIDKPARKVILKRGIKATEYWSYCEEVGCDVWGTLTSMKSLCGEPVCLWLPDAYIKPDTSRYVQGVEVAVDFDGVIPADFDVITLPAAKYLMFTGEPFAEEDFEEAITEVWAAERKYDPAVIGYAWDDSNPRIQLEPIGTRGYIELLPIREKA